MCVCVCGLKLLFYFRHVDCIHAIFEKTQKEDTQLEIEKLKRITDTVRKIKGGRGEKRDRKRDKERAERDRPGERKRQTEREKETDWERQRNRSGERKRQTDREKEERERNRSGEREGYRQTANVEEKEVDKH